MPTNQPSDDIELDAIRARHAAFEASWDHEYCTPNGPANAAKSAEDVPKLLGLIDNLRTEINRLQAEQEKDAVVIASMRAAIDEADAEVQA